MFYKKGLCSLSPGLILSISFLCSMMASIRDASPKSGHSKDAELFQNISDSILSKKIDMEIPSLLHRDCIFEKAGIGTKLARFDHLDKDRLFVFAGHYDIKGFFSRSTDTHPPVSYRELISKDDAMRLLKLVKFKVPCP